MSVLSVDEAVETARNNVHLTVLGTEDTETTERQEALKSKSLNN